MNVLELKVMIFDFDVCVRVCLWAGGARGGVFQRHPGAACLAGPATVYLAGSLN